MTKSKAKPAQGRGNGKAKPVEGRANGRAQLAQFRPQARNVNTHTERGASLLDQAMRKDGWIGAITVADDGETFDGSLRLEKAVDIMADAEPIVVESDGSRPVIIKRTDIASADSPRAKRLAVAANAIASADWNPDGAMLNALAAEDEFIAQLIKNDDKAARALLASVGFEQANIDYRQAWQGMPEIHQDDLEGIILVVHFKDEADREAFFKKLKVPYTKETKYIWYPERPEELRDQLGTRAGQVYTTHES